MSVWNYEGKRVAIVGCYSGMGAATARELICLGAEVHGFDIRPTDQRLASFTMIDMRDPASIDAALIGFDGEIDALFNCAGLPQTFPAIDVMKVNFLGLRHWTEAWLPRIRKGGAVASITSTAGFGYMQRIPLLMELVTSADFESGLNWIEQHADVVGDGYQFSKEASTLWTMFRAAQTIKQGVRMNCTLPGPTETPMMADFERAATAPVIDIFTKPIDRRSTAEEQAYPLIFLNSDAASYVNGLPLFVEGGFVAGVMTGQIDVEAAMAQLSGQ